MHADHENQTGNNAVDMIESYKECASLWMETAQRLPSQLAF